MGCGNRYVKYKQQYEATAVGSVEHCCLEANAEHSHVLAWVFRFFARFIMVSNYFRRFKSFYVSWKYL